MSRTRARELAFLALFSLPHSTDLETVLQSLDQLPKGEKLHRNLKSEDQDFFRQMVSCIVEEWYSFPAILAPVVQKVTKNKWRWERLGKVEQILSIIAYYELIRLHQPPQVVVDAILDLAKQYGEEGSRKFLHGFISEMLKFFPPQ